MQRASNWGIGMKSRPGARSSRPRAEVAAVADNVVVLLRAFSKARAQILAAAAHDVEWSAHVLLKCLATEGPLRSSAIAELIDSDPSTVSRQVAGLVREGLVERRADPVDGRACLLVLTPAADAVLSDHDEVRYAHFARMLAGWDDRDLRDFAALLARFTADFNTTKHELLPTRTETRLAPVGGTT